MLDEQSKGNPDREKVLPKAARYAQRPEAPRILAEFYNSFEDVYRPTPGGVLVKGRRFVTEGARLDRFATRIVKGLFYHEKKYRLPDDYRVNPLHVSRYLSLDKVMRQLTDEMLGMMYETEPTVKGSTFSYRWVQAPLVDSRTWWALEFYGRLCYVCSTTPVEQRLVAGIRLEDQIVAP